MVWICVSQFGGESNFEKVGSLPGTTRSKRSAARRDRAAGAENADTISRRLRCNKTPGCRVLRLGRVGRDRKAEVGSEVVEGDKDAVEPFSAPMAPSADLTRWRISPQVAAGVADRACSMAIMSETSVTA